MAGNLLNRRHLIRSSLLCSALAVPPFHKLLANTPPSLQARTTWSMGAHSATILTHYIGKIESTRVAGFEVDSFVPVDLSYRYRIDDPGWGAIESTTLSLGVNNVFEETPDVIPFPAFQPFLASVHDLRGRMIWASFMFNF